MRFPVVFCSGFADSIEVPWLRELLGDGLLTTDGDVWLRLRRASQPAFTRRGVARIMDKVAISAESVIAQWQRTVARDGEIDLQARFAVRAGQRIPFILSWARPYDAIPDPIDPDAALQETEQHWRQWAETLNLPAQHQALVLRSLITLRACCYRPSGAIVAAPTFGLPETPGGERNWDYRFCWIRDAALTVSAMNSAGRSDEARDFGEWLNKGVGAIPSQLQIMYGIRGERRLTEVALDWLPGYGGARPVRIGNGAYNQFLRRPMR